MSESKRHHYIPRLILRRFATPNEDLGRLYCFNRESLATFPSSPKDAAVINHLYRVEESVNPDSNAIEKFFARIEDIAAEPVERAIASGRIQNRWDHDAIVYLAALQAQRTPRAHDALEGAWLSKIIEDAAKYKSKPSRRRWRMRAEAAGTPEEYHTPEGFIARATSGDFQIRSDHFSWKPSVLLQHALPILVARLQRRAWSIEDLSASSIKLVISDNGAILEAWGNPASCSQGWDSRGADVLFPLSPTCLAVGSFSPDRRLGRSALETVVRSNNASLAWASKFVYGSEQDFKFWYPDSKILSWAEAVENRITFPTLIDASYTSRLFRHRTDAR